MGWMSAHKLKFNPDKIGILLVESSLVLGSGCMPKLDGVSLSLPHLPSKDSVHRFGGGGDWGGGGFLWWCPAVEFPPLRSPSGFNTSNVKKP